MSEHPNLLLVRPEEFEHLLALVEQHKIEAADIRQVMQDAVVFPVGGNQQDYHRMLARVLDVSFGNKKGTPAKVGFALWSFNIGQEGFANYIANVNRNDVMTLMKEWLARQVGMNPGATKQ